MRLSSVFFLIAALAVSVSNTRMHAQTAQSHANDGFESYKSNYKFAERDWNVLTSRLHTTHPPTDTQINSFVVAMLVGVPDFIVQSPKDFASSGLSVCSAGFFQLSGSKSYSLVASIDINGRKFCNFVYVIHRRASDLNIQEIRGFGVDDVNTIVRDLDKNGKSELIITSELSPYAGARCVGGWSRVFNMESGILVDRSAEFKGFYNETLAELDADIQKAKKHETYDDSDSVICSQMEADKIKRFLGVSPSAGRTKAIEWAKSGDGWLRERGFAVLSDIGDAQSISVLARFAKDSDPDVADEAKFALDHTKKK